MKSRPRPRPAPARESMQDMIDRLYAEQRARINAQQREAARAERESVR